MALERSSVAAALSKAGCREDVDCSSGSCISEYTAWMDGELKNNSSETFSAVVKNMR